MWAKVVIGIMLALMVYVITVSVGLVPPIEQW